MINKTTKKNFKFTNENFTSLKFLINTYNGSIIIKIVLNFIRIEKTEKIMIKNKYPFFSSIKFVSVNFMK